MLLANVISVASAIGASTKAEGMTSPVPKFFLCMTFDLHEMYVSKPGPVTADTSLLRHRDMRSPVS